MKRGTMRLALVLLLAIAMLSATWGCAEESDPAGMDVSVDEALASEEARDSGTALSEFAILLFNPPSSTIDFGESVTLTATAVAGGEDVTWTSSDEDVAEIRANADGSIAVVGVGEGTATITCTMGKQSQTHAVTVNPPRTLLISNVQYPSVLKIPGKGWKLGKGSIVSNDDLKTLMSAIKDPNGEMIVDPYTRTFESGVKSFKIKEIDDFVPFARISSEGQYTWMLTATDVSGRSVTVNLPIQAVAEGERIISSTAGKSAPVIQVADAPEGTNAIELQVGEKKKLTATQLLGSDSGNGVIWMSYDPAVSVISPEGEVTGIGAGTTTVVCRTLDNSGFSAGCTVTVRAAAPEAGENANDAGNPPQGDGRNYAINSAFAKEVEDWGKRGEPEIFEVVNSDGVNWLHIKGEAAPSLVDNSNVQGVSQGVFQKYNLHAIPGEAYTLSAKVRGAAADQHCYFNLRWGRDDNSHITNAYHDFTFGEDAQTISITVAAPEEADTITINITTNCESTDGTVGNNVTNEFYITDVKLERGGVPTDWMPAPEDSGSSN